MNSISSIRLWTVCGMPFLLVGAVALTQLACGERRGPAAADLVLWNASVITLDPERPEAAAVAVRDGRIIAVGTAEEILSLAGPETRRIDLKGQTVMPGLVDAHAHVRGLGESLSTIDLRGVESVEDVARLVAARAAALGAGEWVIGRSWDQNLWPGAQFPDHRPLTAAAPDRPVWLRRVDGHAAWANLEAMRTAGITRETPDPPGGAIERDPDGEPTGIFIDKAMDLIDAARPAPTRRQIKEWIRLGLERCARVGLTEIHDAGVGPDTVAAYRELADERALPLRVYLMWDGTGGEPIDHMVEQPPFTNYRDRLTLRAVKLMIDGAMGSRGAAFFEEYNDDPGNRGLLLTPPEAIERMTSLALRHGYQVCTHAIGDRGVSLTLDAYESALKETPSEDPRLRIEHFQCTSREDVKRTKRLNVIASMQPGHATSDMYWAEDRVGPDRGRGLYAWRWALDEGVPVAGGSDFPVETERPFVGIHAAVTRQDAGGWPEGGWHPEQRLSLDEALSIYTTGAAYAAFEEEQKGRLVPGFWADMTVVSEDLRATPPAALHQVAVTHTIVGGEVVFELQ